MKIYFGSDLHLEFEKGSKHTLKVPEGDLLLLAGDVYTPHSTEKNHEKVWKSFFKEVSEKFDQVIYILGNHEHYGGHFYETLDVVKEDLKDFANIRVLNNQWFEYNGLLIFGSTFWTDIRGGDPQIMWNVQRGMNDYSEIIIGWDSYGPHTKRKVLLRAEDTINENKYARNALFEFITEAEDKELFPLIVTHQQPDWACVEEFYRHSDLSYAYANTGLEGFLCDFPQNIWICGHMHKKDQLQLGNSTVLTNTRGYVGYEGGTHRFEFQLIDLELGDNDEDQ